jgi:hypothetical protein
MWEQKDVTFALILPTPILSNPVASLPPQPGKEIAVARL